METLFRLLCDLQGNHSSSGEINLFLANERVDPSLESNEITRSEHSEVMQLLLADHRVAPILSNEVPLVDSIEEHSSYWWQITE